MFFLLLLQIVFGSEIVQFIRISLIISHLILIGKFGTQDSEYIVYGGVFQIRLFDQIFSVLAEHALGRIAADILEQVDDPLVDLVVEFVQIDVFLDRKSVV